MDPKFWKERWERGEIGFHEGRPNQLLEKHIGLFEGRRRVLVPLSGKAVDLRFLAERGLEVVGVELVEAAARAFFEEQALEMSERREGDFLVLESGSISIFVGDFFEADSESFGSFDAVYDRAAIVALPPELRERYAPKLRGLLSEGARMLVLTFLYDGERAQKIGPPFSVSEEELRRHYEGASIERIDSITHQAAERLRHMGLETIVESIHRIDF